VLSKSLPSGSIPLLFRTSVLPVPSVVNLPAPLESQTYKSLFPQLLSFHIHATPPGVSPSVISAPNSALSVLRFFLQLFCQQLTDSCTLLRSFYALSPFVFNHLQTLFPKHSGWGVPPFNPIAGRPPSSQSGTAISGCPPLPSPCQLQCPNACGSKARRAGEEFSPARQCWVANQHINFPSPSGAAKNSSSGTAISGCPPTISQQSSTTTKWWTDDSKTCSPIQPPLEYLHHPLRTSNPCSPKWSIIPAPASATRLRGRSV
jgi:hypothetical protein